MLLSIIKPLFLFNRHIAVEKNRILTVKLYPEISNITKDNPPVASFIIRAISSDKDRKVLVHPGIVIIIYFIHPFFFFLNLDQFLFLIV